jgi:uncharacterized membrane protein
MLRMNKSVRVFILVLFLLVSQVSTVAAQDSIVRILLFYSPACGHCQKVISEDLPPLIEQHGGTPDLFLIPPTPEEEPVGPPLIGIYGGSIQILYVNTLTELGHGLFSEMVDLLSIPPELQAVPTMVVGDNLLIGGSEIPEQLPGIIEDGITGGGIDWIDLPGLNEAMDKLILAPEEPVSTDIPDQEVTQGVASTEDGPEDVPTDIAQSTSPTSEDPPATSNEVPSTIFVEQEFSVLDRVMMDPVGNSVAIFVLIGMIISIAVVGSRLIYPETEEEETPLSWLIPLLSVVGIGVAAYLTYVEASGAEAICGPVGDCNTVQESKYALLFGVIPVGAIGLVGYMAIILSWLTAKFGNNPLVEWAKIGMLAMSLMGTLFSIYLTFLEPFVIGATCAWCITSAILITVLMWLSLSPGTEALVRLRGEGEESTSEE